MKSTTLTDSTLIPGEYTAKDPMTATEVWLRLGELERSAMERMRQGFEIMLDEVIERIVTTSIQFRFPRSKRKRIRKKWRKDPRNFRRLLDLDQIEDIQVVGVD